MSTPKTLLILTDESGPQIFHWSVLSARGVTKEQIEAKSSALGTECEFLTLDLKDPTRKMENDVERACLIPNELAPGSFRMDGTLIAAKRFVTYVKTWTRPDKISEETFTDLPPSLADAIAGLLQAHLYPNTSPDFTQALKDLLGATETPN